MRFITVSALALLAETVAAYRDTSTIMMFSTSSKFTSSSRTDIHESEPLSREISDTLSTCPTNNYVVVRQPGVTAADYKDSKNVPTLASRLAPEQRSSSSVGSSFVASQVLLHPHFEKLFTGLDKLCQTGERLVIDASTGSVPSFSPTGSSNLYLIDFPALENDSTSTSRVSTLAKHDAFLATALDVLPLKNSYTVLYYAIAPEPPHLRYGNASDESAASHHGEEKQESKTTYGGSSYEMEEPLVDGLMPQTDLRRDVGLHARAKPSHNQTMVDGPLFDKYQFFTPGIYMGLGVAALLLPILYIGLRALTGLQVTYAAFDKEVTSLAGKKGQ